MIKFSTKDESTSIEIDVQFRDIDEFLDFVTTNDQINGWYRINKIHINQCRINKGNTELEFFFFLVFF